MRVTEHIGMLAGAALLYGAIIIAARHFLVAQWGLETFLVAIVASFFSHLMVFWHARRKELRTSRERRVRRARAAYLDVE